MARILSTALKGLTLRGILAVSVAFVMSQPTLATRETEVEDCPSSRGLTTSEHRYTLTARARPLLFWVGRDNVGEARIVRREAAEGSRTIELLIGSDPDRAPMRINRWGYIAESLCNGVAQLVGVMTESDEEMIEEARGKVTTGAGEHRFKAIRSRSANGEVTTSLYRLASSENFTYREWASLLARMPEQAATVKHMQLPAGTDTGFLVAVTSLLRETVRAYRQSGRAAPGLQHSFVHDGRLFDLKQRSVRVRPEFRLHEHTYQQAIEGDFQVRNRATGRTTDFRIVYGTAPPALETALQIVYRPRWWFEAELQLTSPE